MYDAIILNNMSTTLNKTVLVMDDELSTVKGVVRVTEADAINALKFDDCGALKAWFDGHSSLLELETTQICLVLNLKFVSEVLADISHEVLSRCPIICICPGTISLNEHQNLATGLFHHLEKPFTLTAMQTTIHAALQEYSKRLNARKLEQSLLDQFQLLTKRETEVCKLVVQGQQNKKISETLGITLKTVKAHRAKVMSKMQATSLPELIRKIEAMKSSPSPRMPTAITGLPD